MSSNIKKTRHGLRLPHAFTVKMAFKDHFLELSPPTSPYLHPLPGTTPLQPLAAAFPPLIYYLALLLLPPFSPSRQPTPSNTLRPVIAPTRNALALIAAVLFFRLPLAYHVPFSVGLTYQLALVGVYGGCRVVDVFFISPYLFNHIPRRVKYHHAPGHDDTASSNPTPSSNKATVLTTASANNASPTHRHPHNPKPTTTPPPSYFTLHFLQTAGQGSPVTETATTLPNPSPTTLLDRLSWALELELSMRGAGFTWTSADVRHTRRTWRPSPRDRLHSIVFHVGPTLLLSWAVVRDVWVHYLAATAAAAGSASPPPPTITTRSSITSFDDLPLSIQLALTASLGAFLMSSFSLVHSLFAITMHFLFLFRGEEGHPLAYFPPLYSVRVWEIVSVRGFWSYGWHRLFSRLFLVYGVWPGQWVERRLRAGMNGVMTLLSLRENQTSRSSDNDNSSKPPHTSSKSPTDDDDVNSAVTGKILGGFLCSGLVHAFAGYTVLGGWKSQGGGGAGGELVFFIENGVAVVFEEAVKRTVLCWRRRRRRVAGSGSSSGFSLVKGGRDGGGGDADADAAEQLQDQQHEKGEGEEGEVKEGGVEEEEGTERRWYDNAMGRIWWVSVLLISGRNFARGWTRAGLVAEMAGGV